MKLIDYYLYLPTHLIRISNVDVNMWIVIR